MDTGKLEHISGAEKVKGWFLLLILQFCDGLQIP